MIKHFTSILLFFLISSFSTAQTNTIIASCCVGNDGTCTGSNHCSACKTCNYCKYCNGGGSCGVCSRGTRNTTSSYYSKTNSSSRTLKTSSNNAFNLPDNPNSPYYLKTLIVNTKTLNLRKGPGSNYAVINTLTLNQELIFLAMTGDWVKVNKKDDDIVGYVYYEYVVVIEN